MLSPVCSFFLLFCLDGGRRLWLGILPCLNFVLGGMWSVCVVESWFTASPGPSLTEAPGENGKILYRFGLSSTWKRHFGWPEIIFFENGSQRGKIWQRRLCVAVSREPLLCENYAMASPSRRYRHVTRRKTPAYTQQPVTTTTMADIIAVFVLQALLGLLAILQQNLVVLYQLSISLSTEYLVPQSYFTVLVCPVGSVCVGLQHHL